MTLECKEYADSIIITIEGREVYKLTGTEQLPEAISRLVEYIETHHSLNKFTVYSKERRWPVLSYGSTPLVYTL